MRSLYWLIERAGQGAPEWLAASQGQGRWWTNNATEALHFGIEQQAQGAALLLEAELGNAGMFRVTEHEFG